MLDKIYWVRREPTSEWEPAGFYKNNSGVDYFFFIGEEYYREVAEVGPEIIQPQELKQ